MPELRTRAQQEINYTEKHAFLMFFYGDPVTCHDFYLDLFGEGFLQTPYKRDPDARHDGKPVAIANVVHESSRDGHLYRKNHYVPDGFGALEKLENRVAYLPPCSFMGGKKDLDHLRFIHALVVDLDYVGPQQIQNLEHQINIGYVPRPTYIVNSGTGLHLYFMFDRPQPAWPDKRPGYVALKYALINLCWTEFTSQSVDRQFSGLVQPYRVIGSRSKLDCDSMTGKVVSHEWPVMAWKTGEKWSLDELLDFEPFTTVATGHWSQEIDKARKVFRPETNADRLTLDKAKELYPEWYERRIIQGEPPTPFGEKKWHVNPRVYEWWLRRIRDEAVVGHRYFCVMMLAVYAVKCDVSYEKLKADAEALYEPFEQLTDDETNHFKRSDISQALQAYRNKRYATLPINSIEHFSGLRIDKDQTRKGRPQLEHLEEARAIRDIRQRRQGTHWYDNGGRPRGSGEKRDLIRNYATAHPDATHAQIARELGVSRTTVVKWLRDWTPPNDE